MSNITSRICFTVIQGPRLTILFLYQMKHMARYFQIKKKTSNSSWTFHYVNTEITHTSPQSSLARINHMIPPNFKETKELNVPICLEWKEKWMWKSTKKSLPRAGTWLWGQVLEDDINPRSQGITVSYKDF